MKMKKGISLIVLVITILVIIVLAGAVILTVVTNNPLEKANEGIFKSDVKTFAQELSISMSNAMLNSKDPKGINATKDTDILAYITSMTGKQKYLDILEVQSGELVYVASNENEKKWAEEAGIKAGGKYTQEYSHDKPYIPEGFEYVEGSWDTGYVIQDKEKKNQFVWIPVEDITKLVRYPIIQAGNYTTTEVDQELNNASDANAAAMKESITKYKGFYRSRYEIGNESGVPVSKKGATVWHTISWTDSLALARKMYNTSEIATDLIYGSQWDYISLWLKDAGYNVTDSRFWGNHNDYNGPALESGITAGVLNKTGSSENWKANNIYDMAGNAYEWTQESQSAGLRYVRGGGYNSSGSNLPVSLRGRSSESDSSDRIGFAVSLYKK